MSDEADFTQFFGGTYLFQNEGTFRKTGEGTTTAFNPIPVVNSGVLLVEEGTVDLHQGLNHSGTVTLFAGTTLRLLAGTHTFTTASQTVGAGTLLLQNTTFSVGSGQVVAIETPLRMTGGTLTGQGRLRALGGLDWSGGTMIGTGVTELPAGTVNSLSGTGVKDIREGWTLENFGAVTMSGGALRFAQTPATVINRPGGEWVVSDEADFTQFFGGTYTFVNEGTLRKTGLGTQTMFNPVTLQHSGVLLVDEGEIELHGNATFAGPVNIASDGTVHLAGASHTWNDGVSFAGEGALVISRPLTLTVPVDFDDLKVTFDGAATVSGAFALSSGAGGEVHVNKGMTFPGDWNVAGLYRIADPAHTVTIAGTLTLASSGTIDNSGTLRVGAFVDNGGTLIGNAPVVVGLGPNMVRIDSVDLLESGLLTPGRPQLSEIVQTVVLTWRAESGALFAVEMSEDLTTWRRPSAHIEELVPGLYGASLIVPKAPQYYFRLERLTVGE